MVISYLAPGQAGSFKCLDAHLPINHTTLTHLASKLGSALARACWSSSCWLSTNSCNANLLGKKKCQTRLGCKHGPTIHAQKWKPFHTCGQQPLPKGSTWLVRNKLSKSGAFRNAQHYMWKCQQAEWFPTVGTVLKFFVVSRRNARRPMFEHLHDYVWRFGNLQKKHVKVDKANKHMFKKTPWGNERYWLHNRGNDV